VQVAHLDELDSFTTLDGSSIRELFGPAWTAARNHSLAEARLPPGGATFAHYHDFEEAYYFVSGRGRMRLGEEEADVVAGDCVVIPTGVPHKLWASDDAELVLLCTCAPAYTHEGTTMLEGPDAGLDDAELPD
jgi:mannose-6-phosphate isomerase-like protein (cupin superfamily)